MKIMSGAFVVILLYSGSFARVAEPAPVPGNWPGYPESVEQAMIDDVAVMASQTSGSGVFVVSQSSEGFGVLETSATSESKWEGCRLPEAGLDFIKAKPLLADNVDRGRKKYIEMRILVGMAEVAERRGRWAEAQARLEQYLKNYPEDIEVLQRLAGVMYCQGDFARAYDILKRAEEIDVRIAAKNHTPRRLLPAPKFFAQVADKCEPFAFPERRQGNGNVEKWFRYAVKQAPNDLNLRAAVAVWALENGEMATCQGAGQRSPADREGRPGPSLRPTEVSQQHDRTDAERVRGDLEQEVAGGRKVFSGRPRPAAPGLRRQKLPRAGAGRAARHRGKEISVGACLPYP